MMNGMNPLNQQNNINNNINQFSQNQMNNIQFPTDYMQKRFDDTLDENNNQNN